MGTRCRSAVVSSTFCFGRRLPVAVFGLRTSLTAAIVACGDTTRLLHDSATLQTDRCPRRTEILKRGGRPTKGQGGPASLSLKLPPPQIAEKWASDCTILHQNLRKSSEIPGDSAPSADPFGHQVCPTFSLGISLKSPINPLIGNQPTSL